MRVVWLTDLHLNFLTFKERLTFYQTIVDIVIDAVLISGDIAEASSINDFLIEMSQIIGKPIYFVLGNHDYYGDSVKSVRFKMTGLTQTVKYLYWLPASGVQKLEADTLLVGIDGFADGRYGDYERSFVSLNDSDLITELYQEKLLSKRHLQLKMQQFADEDANLLQKCIETGIETHNPRKIIILTHVPPFPDVCFYRQRQTDDDYLPYFSSKATGDVLLKVADCYPSVVFLAFCGHTHGYACSQPLSNLTVTVGAAEYYHPEIQKIIVL